LSRFRQRQSSLDDRVDERGQIDGAAKTRHLYRLLGGARHCAWERTSASSARFPLPVIYGSGEATSR
jgi:hypothetical protein